MKIVPGLPAVLFECLSSSSNSNVLLMETTKQQWIPKQLGHFQPCEISVEFWGLGFILAQPCLF